MAENTHIEWAMHTFNPWEGCTKVSTGCKNCYAETRNARFGGGEAVNWGKGAPRRRTSVANWNLPLKWNRDAEKSGTRPRVFCASLADVFDDEVPIGWLHDLMNLIAMTPHLAWLLLTKRPENIASRLLSGDKGGGWDGGNFQGFCLMTTWLIHGKPPENVWLGTSVENQDTADTRIPELLKVPAKVHFLSCEPLLGAVNLTKIPSGIYEMNPLKGQLRGTITRDIRFCNTIDWVIAGGESGPGARPMHPEWACGLRDQCEAANVPFLFKQWGEWEGADRGHPTDGWATFGHDGSFEPLFPSASVGKEPRCVVRKVGKKRAGRLLDGREHNEFPEVTN